MKGISRMLFLAVLALSVCSSLSTREAPLENPFPLGTIGCLASDVCGPGEVCKDDLLFGSCQDVFGRHRPRDGSRNVFRLDSREVERLEQTILTLIQDGFTWQDAYTQCTLQNLLVAFQRGIGFSPRLCEDALGVSLPSPRSWPLEINAEVTALLKELMQNSLRSSNTNSYSSSSSFYPDQAENSEREPESLALERRLSDGLYPRQEDSGYNDVSYGNDGIDLVDSNKRDEFVQVHKYFDQSKGQFKRDPYLREMANPYSSLAALAQDAVQVQGDQGPAEGEVQDVPYLPEMRDMEQESFGKVKEEDERFFDLSPQAVAGMESSMGGGGGGNGDGNLQLGSSEAASEDGPSAEVEEQEDRLPMSLSPSDEATLEQLLEGTVEPDQLPLEQQRRLSRFIEVMISTLEMQDSQARNHMDVVEEAPKQEPPSEHDPIATQEAATLSEDVDDQGSDDPVINSDETRDSPHHVKEHTTDEEAADEETADEEAADVEPPSGPAEENLNEDNDIEVDKKSEHQEPQERDLSEDSDKKAVVKTRYTYIKLNDKIDENKAQTFVKNLTKALRVPAGVANLDQVNGDQLILKIANNPQWNSSRLAKEAEDHSDALYRDTGLRVLDAGIGKGVTVEVQKKDGGHEVLTFILVGSIAGVVLAVTIIYLFRRHRRSQQKLAQLSSTGDGNEASKDYQDLCRQRMQSKASEKPEPLHAASRIGSVSENQVRSPSSRSSTSSWSEEPAATNMDISTGHVVLAYMEDHLKNGDRLEQEWEALAAYQADPCSTAIANDSSNARKNRYSDVLPYDHSRVVLYAATNVTNSDYVNASFITDHDPRNPAYICTQGPLPHTVADFWQMVWEQGSVVIVMLTKLTEDGSAMCHRYWPEEGSDLYHIYEVHLVSEHIWCDDYLVRSFYLKNLQTNETRTVTQFHFLTWPHLRVPPSMKALLDFRRKVNKSFRGGSCPIVLHCNDGCGRSGTYCLIDMVLNRMAKGAKEIDMAATLEHIRDQRMGMVQTKEQFQFALSAVAEEVHAILKALPQ